MVARTSQQTTATASSQIATASAAATTTPAGTSTLTGFVSASVSSVRLVIGV